MLVTIDTDQLVRDAATFQMDDKYKYYNEDKYLVWAIQKQIGNDKTLIVQMRKQVKEYKKLTMWRD
jgi:hypothetical protein